MCRAYGRTAHAAPGLEYDDAHVTLGASGKGLAPSRTVAVTLDVHRHNPHAIEQRDLAEQRWSVDHRRVACRDDGVQALAGAVRHADHADIAAVGDECDSASDIGKRHGIAPQGRPRHHADQAVAIRADDGHAAGCRHQIALQVRAPCLSEARGVDDRSSAAQRSSFGDVSRHGVRRGRDNDSVDSPGFGERRHARHARGTRARGVDSDHAAGEVRAREVEQRRVRVGALAVGSADDGHAPRCQQATQICHRSSIT